MVTLRSVLVFAAFLPACSAVNDPGGYIGPPPGPPVVRVVHLARDTALVDVLVDGETRFGGIDFGGATEDETLPSGVVTLEVQRDSGETLLVDDFELSRGRRYTLAIYGDEIDPPFGDRGLAMLLLRDDLTPFDDGTQIRVTVTHLASPVEAGNLVVVLEGSDLLIADEFGFGAIARPGPLAATQYTVGFDAGADDSVDFIFDLPGLVPGTYANVFVACDPDGNPFLFVNTRGGTRAVIPPRPTTM